MSEPRISPAAGPNPTTRAAPGPRWRDIQFVEFEPAVEQMPVYEEAPAPVFDAAPEPVGAIPITVALAPPANSNEPLRAPISVANTALSIFDDPEPGPAPPPGPRAPRYGRAIAQLPRHLIASVPAPPRTSLPPAQVKLRPPTASLGKRGVLRGSQRQRGTGRGLRWATLGLVVTAAMAVLYRGDIVSGFAASPHPAPPQFAPTSGQAAPQPRQTVTAAAVPAPPAMSAAQPPGAVPAVAPAPPVPADPTVPSGDQVAYLVTQAKGGDTGAQYSLAVLYARGDGVAKDYATAATWFREAAINGNTAAQYNLGVLYERGLGIPQNMNEALIWYHSAAARNYPAAQYNLALSYAEGRGTPQDMVAAARWYRRAAEQGVVPAMVNFAILCETGQGTIQSPMTAYAWYHAAAARGDEVATKRADELYRQFSIDDRKGADAAANTANAAIHEPAVTPTATPTPSPASPAPARNSGGMAQATG